MRRQEGEEAGESDKDEAGGGVKARFKILSIEMAGTEEEAEERFDTVLKMEVEVEENGEVEEGGDGNQRALGALEFLTQDA